MPPTIDTPSALCRECSKPLVRGRGGPPPTYCSGSCRAKAGARRAKADGRYQARVEKAKAERQAERAANAKPCPYCGDPMLNPQRVQCGKPECHRLWNNARNASYQRRYKEATGQYHSRRYTYERTCIECGRTWTSQDARGKYCSNACQAAHEHGPDRRPKSSAVRRRLKAQRKLASAAAGSTGHRVLIAGPCARCGTQAISRRPTVSGLHYCSKRCRRLERAAARRALSRNTHVDRQAIYRRDKWICQLCRKPVARTKVVPHPKAPVLDHIVPVAEHGDHDPANLQLAHFLCNSRKQHRGGGEQLMLIG